MVFRRTLFNAALYAVGPQIPRVVSFLLLPLFTQYLSTEDYGAAGVVFSYTGLLGGLGDLGLHVHYSNLFFKDPDGWKKKWERILGILAAWMVTFAILQALLLITFLPSSLDPHRVELALLSSVSSLFFAAHTAVAMRLLQFRERATHVALISATSGILTVALNYWFIAHLRIGFMGWFYSSFLAAAFQAVIMAYYLFAKEKLRINFRIRKQYARVLLAMCAPLVLHNYAGYILDSSDRFLLDRLGRGLDEIGRYSFAYLFASYFDFGVQSVGTAVAPLMARLYYGKHPDRKRALYFLLASAQCFVLLAALFASLFLGEVFAFAVKNDKLRDSLNLAVILIFSYAFRPTYWYSNAILTYNGRTDVLWRLTFVAGSVSFVANLVLIPKWGAAACAFTTVGAYALISVLGLTNAQFRRYNEVSVHWLPAIAAPILLMGLSLAVQHTHLLFRLGLVAALAVLAALGLGIVARRFPELVRAIGTAESAPR